MRKLYQNAIQGTYQEKVDEKGYFCDYQDNIFKKRMPKKHKDMFKIGSGGELASKAKAIHSSSMLSYNFFSWICEETPFIYDNITFKEVFFEVRLRTLKSRSATANMDVVLRGEKEDGRKILFFIESKFTEYLNSNKFDISDAYLDPKNYYRINHERFKAIIDEFKNNESEKMYYEGIKQSICHLIGINNLHDSIALSWLNKNNKRIDFYIDNIDNYDILFASVIFEPDESSFKNEHQKYQSYFNLYNKLKERSGVENLSPMPQWISYSKIWDAMNSDKNKVNLGEGLKKYLYDRYMRIAKK